MISTRFLPMSCTSPFTVASTIVPFSCPSMRSMNGSRYATAVFIVSALCSTNGNCILPAPNRSPTTFMPSSSTLLMMSSGDSLFQIVRQALAVTIDDAVLQPSFHRVRALLHGGISGLAVGENLKKPLQRVIAVRPSIEDQVLGDLHFLRHDRVQRADLRYMHNCAGHSCAHGIVQEH